MTMNKDLNSSIRAVGEPPGLLSLLLLFQPFSLYTREFLLLLLWLVRHVGNRVGSDEYISMRVSVYVCMFIQKGVKKIRCSRFMVRSLCSKNVHGKKYSPNKFDRLKSVWRYKILVGLVKIKYWCVQNIIR